MKTNRLTLFREIIALYSENRTVASAGGELTIDAFPPVQVLWMCCRTGAMGVILGVKVQSLSRDKEFINQTPRSTNGSGW